MIRKYRPPPMTLPLVIFAAGIIATFGVWWFDFVDTYWRLHNGNILHITATGSWKCLLPWKGPLLECRAIFTDRGSINMGDVTKRQIAIHGPWIIGVLALGTGAWFRWIHEPDTTVIEGPQIGGLPDLRKAMQDDPDDRTMEIVPGISLTRTKLLESVAVLGGTGSGKTNLFQHFQKGVIARGDRTIFFAFKNLSIGSIPARDANDSMIIIAPDDARSWIWDTARDVVTEAEAIRFADYLIPHQPHEVNQFFTNAARTITVGMLMKLKAEHGQQWTWGHVFAELETPLATLIENLSRYYPLAAGLLDKDTKLAGNVQATLVASLMNLRLLAIAWHDPSEDAKKVSIRDFILGDDLPKTLVLGRSGDFGEASDRWISIFLSIAGDTIQSNDYPFGDERPLWFLIDEMAQLPKIAQFNTILTTGREKGVAMVLGMQSIPQVVERYGRDTFESWFANIGTKIIGKTSNGGAARELAKLFGETRVREKTRRPVGSGTYNDFNKRDELAYKPYDFAHRLGRLKFRGVRMLFTGICLDLCEVIVPFYGADPKTKAVRPNFVRAPWVNETREGFKQDQERIAEAQTVDPATVNEADDDRAEKEEAGPERGFREREEATDTMRGYTRKKARLKREREQRRRKESQPQTDT